MKKQNKKSKQQASLSKAFENNPKSDSAFYSYLTFIIENNEHTLIHNMIMKRFYHIGITPVTLNKMILDIADTVYKSNHQLIKKNIDDFLVN